MCKRGRLADQEGSYLKCRADENFLADCVNIWVYRESIPLEGIVWDH
jgi:hypothetical protein